MKGFFNRILRIHLKTKTFQEETLPDSLLETTLGGKGLGNATSDRGACHLRATFYKAELAGMIPMDQMEGKTKLFLEFEDRFNIHNSLILC